MGTKAIKTGTRTATRTTDEYTFDCPEKMVGEIVKIELEASGGADFKICTLKNGTEDIDEYIYGSVNDSVSVATSTHLSPGEILTNSDAGEMKETRVPFTSTQCKIKMEVSNLTPGDTWCACIMLRR